ncbi:MAG: hypothetical protein ACN6OP_03400 [Pseudomonadales bacterium]
MKPDARRAADDASSTYAGAASLPDSASSSEVERHAGVSAEAGSSTAPARMETGMGMSSRPVLTQLRRNRGGSMAGRSLREEG